MLALFLSFWLGAQVLTSAPVPQVLSDSRKLPPSGGVWVGDAPHVFLDGQVTLFCGSHGTFSRQAVPPVRRGQSAIIRYGAVFSGELILRPPVVSEIRSYKLDDPIRMTERVTLSRSGGSREEFTTELTELAFTGSDFPNGLQVRESARHRSMGQASIVRHDANAFRIQSTYRVWLELSLDGGASWHPAGEAVTMTLAPQVKTATLKGRQINH